MAGKIITALTAASGADLTNVVVAGMAAAGTEGRKYSDAQLATILFNAPTILGGTHTGITALGIRSTGSGAFDLTLANTENLSAGRTLTLKVNDAARTVDLGGNLTLANNFITTGAFSLTLTSTATTVATFPAGTVTLAQLGANTFTGLQTITQASANAGILASTGYSLTGSNATGMIDLAGTLNTSGTPTVFKLAITNTASNGSSLAMQILGGAAAATNLMKLSIGGTMTLNGDLNAGAGGYIGFLGRGYISSPADSILTLTNTAATDFARLQFGGTTSSFPSLKRSTTAIQCRLADDSNYAPFAASGYSAGATAGVTAGPFTTITGITVVGGIVTALTGA